MFSRLLMHGVLKSYTGKASIQKCIFVYILFKTRYQTQVFVYALPKYSVTDYTSRP